MKFTKFIFLLSFLLFVSCDNGTDKNIFMDGEILNFGEFGQIEVEVVEDNRTRDSADVNDDGTFNLNFNSSLSNRPQYFNLSFNPDLLIISSTFFSSGPLPIIKASIFSLFFTSKHNDPKVSIILFCSCTILPV